MSSPPNAEMLYEAFKADAEAIRDKAGEDSYGHRNLATLAVAVWRCLPDSRRRLWRSRVKHMAGYVCRGPETWASFGENLWLVSTVQPGWPGCGELVDAPWVETVRTIFVQQEVPYTAVPLPSFAAAQSRYVRENIPGDLVDRIPAPHVTVLAGCTPDAGALGLEGIGDVSITLGTKPKIVEDGDGRRLVVVDAESAPLTEVFERWRAEPRINAYDVHRGPFCPRVTLCALTPGADVDAIDLPDMEYLMEDRVVSGRVVLKTAPMPAA